MISECLGINEIGHLTIGGLDVAELAAKFGTPLYLMDEDLIRKTCREYRDAMEHHFDGNCLVTYASKAFCAGYMYKILAEEGLGADVVSGGELYTALCAGFDASRIFFHGNNKTREEMVYAVRSGVGHIIVDNREELHLLNSIACEEGKIVDIMFKAARVTNKNLTDFIGPAKFKRDHLHENDEIGVVNGLAWTQVGGEMLEVEVNVLDGSGKLELTGNLGDVMKESAKAALTYIRSRAANLGIDPDFYKTKDLHIHFPEGAIPKDGPSAGITTATAMISALTRVPVKRSVAMTGEITLRGRVLAIGGLKEKTMAAFRNGIDTVIIPEDNVPDLSEIDPAVAEALHFVPVAHVDQLLPVAFTQDIVKWEASV